MQMSDVSKYARALYNAHGDQAEAEAAQKATSFEAANDTAQAEQWRSVQRAIRGLRGANQS